MREITLPSGYYIFLQVPNYITDIKVVKAEEVDVITYNKKYKPEEGTILPLPSKSWKFLSNFRDIEDEIAESIVEQHNGLYRDYETANSFTYILPSYSLDSLLLSAGIEIDNESDLVILKKY